MRALLLNYWDRVRSSFWFLPSLMAAAAVGMALLTVALDEGTADRWIQSLSWVYGGGAAGASEVLGTIAGSMMTIAGVVFSMTLVALTLASSQFGPRLLRSFMRDTVNQVVLGTFVATFLFCLLVLRTVRREEDAVFVPHLSVTLGLVFAVLSIGVLIYFIHHVSVSIQADEIVARVGAELDASMKRLFPEPGDTAGVEPAHGAGMEDLQAAIAGDARPVAVPEDGYLQFIDIDHLLVIAGEHDLVMQVKQRPGQYVTAGRPLVLVSPASRISDRIAAGIGKAIIVGSQRTPAQDVEFPVSQLVEIAVRALSPGVNDPFTAIRCIDRLGSAMYRLVQRPMPSPYRRDGTGRLRVVTAPVTFAAIMDSAFNQIRQNAASSAAVTIRLLEVFELIAERVDRPEDGEALRRHSLLVANGALRSLPDEEDRAAVQERLQRVTWALERSNRPV